MIRRPKPDPGFDIYAGPQTLYYRSMLKKGLVQIYTGEGKGKTTAAFGLALRAAGQGNKVLVYQFLKPPSMDSGERFAIERWRVKIRIEALDVDWNVFDSLGRQSDVAEARKAIDQTMERLAETAQKGFYDVIVLDELVFCLAKKLVKFEDVKRIVETRSPRVELVMTGRGAGEELIGLADLVTEMKNVKHPFDRGTVARQGIEY